MASPNPKKMKLSLVQQTVRCEREKRPLGSFRARTTNFGAKGKLCILLNVGLQVNGNQTLINHSYLSTLVGS